MVTHLALQHPPCLHGALCGDADRAGISRDKISIGDLAVSGGTKATEERVIYLLFTGPGVPDRVTMRDCAVGLRHLPLSTELLAI